MKSFTKALSRIAQLGRLGALGDDGDWFAAGIEIHVAEGWSLDRALTLAWSNECRRRRDDKLRKFAGRYCREDLLSRRVAKLGHEIRVYQLGAWRHDSARTEMPSSYASTPRALLFWAFMENESIEPRRDMPSSCKQLERILSRSDYDGMFGHAPPIPMSKKIVSNASNDGERTNARENVSQSGQRGRQGGRR